MYMTKKRKIHFTIQISLFLFFYFVSYFFLSNVYVAKWTADRYYLGIWIVALLFIKKEKPVSSYLITAGNFLGILAGEFIGGAIRKINMSKITPAMDSEIIYRLSSHYGVFIWAIVIIISFVSAVIIARFMKKG